MSDKTDHTAAIFERLGITPEKHPWAYWLDTGEYCNSLDRYMREYAPLTFNEVMESYEDSDIAELSLLDDSLEADGLAVRLYEIATLQKKVTSSFLIGGELMLEDYGVNNIGNLAHAVHDALVHALGIGDRMKREDNR